MRHLPWDGEGDDAGSLTAQSDIAALLETAGARIRGRNRADCPDCGGKRTVAVDESKGVFHCHHAGCEFSGGIGTLRQRLGIEREWLPKVERIRQCRQRERVSEAARRLYHAAKVGRFELLEELHALNRIEAGAHRAGPTEAGWGALAVVYQQRPAIEAELDRLEGGSAAEVLQSLDEGKS